MRELPFVVSIYGRYTGHPGWIQWDSNRLFTVVFDDETEYHGGSLSDSGWLEMPPKRIERLIFYLPDRNKLVLASYRKYCFVVEGSSAPWASETQKHFVHLLTYNGASVEKRSIITSQPIGYVHYQMVRHADGREEAVRCVWYLEQQSKEEFFKTCPEYKDMLRQGPKEKESQAELELRLTELLKRLCSDYGMVVEKLKSSGKIGDILGPSILGLNALDEYAGWREGL